MSAAPAGGAAPATKTSPGSQPTEVNVTKDPGHRYGEPEVAVNPRNPNDIVYAALTIVTTYACQRAQRPACLSVNSAYGPQPAGLINDIPGSSVVRVYVSSDGGKTWTRSTDVPASPPSHPDLIERGDPLLTVGPDGTFYLGWDDIHFGNLPTTIIRDGGIAVSKSTDGGRTWSKPVLTGTPVDRPFFAADGSTGMIYEASSGVLGANSTGDSSLPPTPITASGDRWLVASRDGVHWTAPKPFGGVPSFPIGAFGAVAHGVFATAFNTTTPALCDAAPTCTVFQTTTDAGTTWSRHVLPMASGSSGAPVGVAADPKVMAHYTVAVANAAHTEFLVYQTGDGGSTWTGPTTVAEDPAKTHFHSWLAYSPTGVLGFMWQTNESGPAGPAGGLPAALPAAVPQENGEEQEEQAAGPQSPYSVWAATSDDGGATFSAPLRVSRANSPPPQAFIPFGVADDFSFITLSGTHAFVGWADYRPGDRSGFFSAIPLDAFKSSS